MANSPDYGFRWGPSPARIHEPPARLTVNCSSTLIAMVIVVVTAFVVVTYYRVIYRNLCDPILDHVRLWRARWRLWRIQRNYSPSTADIESITSIATFESATTPGHHFLSPARGLDEIVIKAIPLSVYNSKNCSNDAARDCAVCLLDFRDNDYVRTLPACAHSFHVDCIDMWLRSQANCPLCRAGVVRSESPFVPMMADRIRPNLDDRVSQTILLEHVSGTAPESEISPYVAEASASASASASLVSPRRNENHERYTHNYNGGRDFLMKRSYSFGFESKFTVDRFMSEPATATPCRYQRANFWRKSRVFAFRHYREMKSPFFERRSGFFPLSESSLRFSGEVFSRGRKSSVSPMSMRTSVGVGVSSSGIRCGDPDALLSPERFVNQRW